MLFKLYKECMLVSLELLRNKGMNENRVLRSKKQTVNHGHHDGDKDLVENSWFLNTKN